MSDLIPEPEKEDIPLDPVPVAEKGEGIEKAVISVSQKELYVAPLPPPSYMKGYQEVLPGSPNRIFTMAEEEQRYSHEMDRLALTAEIEDSKKARNERRLGQVFAFLITIILGGCGTVAILNGQPVAGSVLGASGVTGVVSVFITGRRGKDGANNSDKTGITAASNRKEKG